MELLFAYDGNVESLEKGLRKNSGKGCATKCVMCWGLGFGLNLPNGKQAESTQLFMTI